VVALTSAASHPTIRQRRWRTAASIWKCDLQIMIFEA